LYGSSAVVRHRCPLIELPGQQGNVDVEVLDRRTCHKTTGERDAFSGTRVIHGTLYGSEQNQGQQRAAITSRPGSDWSSSVTMTLSAAPRGSTRSKAVRLRRRGTRWLISWAKRSQCSGNVPAICRGHVDGAACDGPACRPPMPLDRTAERGEVSSGRAPGRPERDRNRCRLGSHRRARWPRTTAG
jgi:hypothetical protein